MYETLVLFVQKVYTISMETSKDISDKNARKSCDFEWHGKAIGLLDLDAFFASVEQLDHPEWLGKPVIVGGSPHKRGVVSTASYEARKFGVHSAMPSAIAVRLCPHAIWTSGRYDRYSEMSALVMGFLKDETPLVEQVSIDEAFFDITPGRFSKENPLEICKRIQKKVAALGVTCSIGLGTNKTIAKIASEQEKPRGLTAVFPGTEGRFLAPLPIEAMSGIGPAMAKTLHQQGIRTLGELSRADATYLTSLVGNTASKMILRAQGKEVSEVHEAAQPRDVKSVSNERTFETDLFDKQEIEEAIRHIAGVVGRRLRRKRLQGYTVTLKVKASATESHTAQKRMSTPTDDEHLFAEIAVGLLPTIWKEGQPVRLLGVGISSFSDEEHAKPVQASLFDQFEATFDAAAPRPTTKKKPRSDLRHLSEVTDKLKDKFGADAVQYGRDLRFEHRVSDTMPTGKNEQI